MYRYPRALFLSWKANDTFHTTVEGQGQRPNERWLEILFTFKCLCIHMHMSDRMSGKKLVRARSISHCYNIMMSIDTLVKKPLSLYNSMSG